MQENLQYNFSIRKRPIDKSWRRHATQRKHYFPFFLDLLPVLAFQTGVVKGELRGDETLPCNWTGTDQHGQVMPKTHSVKKRTHVQDCHQWEVSQHDFVFRLIWESGWASDARALARGAEGWRKTELLAPDPPGGQQAPHPHQPHPRALGGDERGPALKPHPWADGPVLGQGPGGGRWCGQRDSADQSGHRTRRGKVWRIVIVYNVFIIIGSDIWWKCLFGLPKQPIGGLKQIQKLFPMKE